MRKVYIIAAVLCAIATLSYAQSSRTGEGVSRQVTALKNMMESHADSVATQISGITTRLGSLEAVENARTACFNMTGESHIYWPNHSSADSNGCISESSLGSGQGAGTCSGSLIGGHNSCADCTAAGGTPHADPLNAGEFFCKFDGVSGQCPSGFTKYQQWNSYTSNSCSSAYGTTCHVSGSGFENGPAPVCYRQECRDTNKGCYTTTCAARADSVGCQ
ncbi:MAG: hypothetical protein VX730_05805 [Pseudomonadota bacterium]|nr:hypothetical protein [Pseudomonadota bacterium]